jgi:preprotein translocase subunit SecG
MITFVTVVHILIALLLILITFVQDSKSDSLGGAFGGGGSNSLFGAVGATTFIQKMTWWLAGLFAVTSISLAYFSSQGSKSVLDSVVVPSAPASAPSETKANEGSVSTQESAPVEANAPVTSETEKKDVKSSASPKK